MVARSDMMKLKKAANAAHASLKKIATPAKNLGLKGLLKAAKAAQASMEKIVKGSVAMGTAKYNAQRRQIYTGHRGGMYVIGPSGHKKYGVKARYQKTANGSMVSLVPTRRTRKNAGMKRGPRRAASPVLSILPNPFIRRTRKNAGTKRGPRARKAAAGMGTHIRFTSD